MKKIKVYLDVTSTAESTMKTYLANFVYVLLSEIWLPKDICRKIACSPCRNFAGTPKNSNLSELCLRLLPSIRSNYSWKCVHFSSFFRQMYVSQVSQAAKCFFLYPYRWKCCLAYHYQIGHSFTSVASIYSGKQVRKQNLKNQRIFSKKYCMLKTKKKKLSQK